MLKSKFLNILSISLIIIATLSSCDFNKVYEESIVINEGVWSRYNIAKFDIDIDDTINNHNIDLNIDHTEMYKYSNLYLFVKTSFPDGFSFVDTIDCKLADHKGYWLGKGSEKIKNQIRFKSSVRFPKIGNYTIEVEQAMRDIELSEILSIGVRVEEE